MTDALRLLLEGAAASRAQRQILGSASSGGALWATADLGWRHRRGTSYYRRKRNIAWPASRVGRGCLATTGGSLVISVSPAGRR